MLNFESFPRKFQIADKSGHLLVGPFDMSTAFWVQGRSLSQNGAYKGEVILKQVNNPTEEVTFWDSVDLIYLTFALSKTKPTNEQLRLSEQCYLAMNVIDLDFKDDLKQQVAAATMAGDCSALRRLCKEALDALSSFFLNVPYRVYASGSKGIHVYAKDPRLLIKSEKGYGAFTSRTIRSVLESTLQSSAVLTDYLKRDIIDLSPYHGGKGIRPFCCAHPSTGITPFLLFESGDWKTMTWLEWARDSIVRQDIVPLARFADYLPVEQQHSSVPAAIQSRLVPAQQQVTLDEFSDLSLLEFLREKSGQPSLVLSKSVKRFKYFTLPEGKGTWCQIAKRFHNTLCSNWRSFENGVHLCQCFNAECCSKRLILRKHIQTPVTFPRDTVIAPENLSVLASSENSTYLPDDVLGLLKAHPRIVLASPMGGGKTYRVMKFIESLPAETSIVAIGSRIQQIKAWHSKFEKLGFEIYDENKGSLFGHKRLLICLNSIPRLLGAQGEFPSVDVVVVDECDSAARWLGGPLLGSSVFASQSLIFFILQLLLARAKRVIMMDGLPTKCTGRFLEVMNCFDKFHWVVHNSLKFKHWTFVNSTNYFTNAFKNHLLAGKRAFFVSNSKKFLYLFADIAVKVCGLDRNRTLVISGDMSCQNRIAAGNPDSWTAYDAIFCNGSLGPGASFDIPWFHSVFTLVNVRNGVTPVDIAQLVERPRHLIDGNVMALVLKKSPEEGYKTEQEILQQKKKTVGYFYGCAIPVVQVFEDSRKAEMKQKQRDKEHDALARGLVAKSKNGGRKTKKVIEHQPLVFKTVFDQESGELREELADPGVTIRLAFEETGEMKLAAAVDEMAKYWCRDSEPFLLELQSIVTRGGSGIMTIGHRTSLDNTGKDIILGSHAGYFSSLKKNELEKKHDELEHIEDSYYLRSLSGELSEELFAKAKLLAEVDKPGVMKRFAQILRSYNAEAGSDCIAPIIDKECNKLFRVEIGKKRTRTEQQGPFSKIFIQADGLPRASINRKVTNGELFNFFNNMICAMGYDFGHEDKRFTGKFETRQFCLMPEVTRNALTDAMLDICKLRRREDPTFVWKELKRDRNDLGTFTKWILKIFAWCGFPLIKEKRHRTFIQGVSAQGSKTVWYDLVPDSNTFNFRKALLGLGPDGRDIGTLPAVKQFFQ